MKNKNQGLAIANICLIIISSLICSIYIILYLMKKDLSMALFSLLSIVILFVIYIIDKKLKVKIPVLGKTVYLIFVLLAAILGGVVNLYDYLSFYDLIVHFASGILISWLFAIYYLKLYKKIDIREFIFSMICFNATIALIWEVIEYTYDFIFHKHLQGGNNDTMTDLIVSVIGSVIVSLIYIYKLKDNRMKEIKYK